MMHTLARTTQLAREKISGRQGKETAIVELGSGHNGATEGLEMVVTRVIQQDGDPPSIARENGVSVKAKPDIVKNFQDADPAIGPVLQAARMANVRLKKELVGTWVSWSCKRLTTAQGFQKGTKWAGPAAGAMIPPEDTKAMKMVMSGIKKAQKKAPRAQWVLENPGTSYMWKLPQALTLTSQQP